MNYENALLAIRARINGEYDHPALDGYILSTDIEQDILDIISDVIPTKNTLT